jgi:hypothetical protein
MSITASQHLLGVARTIAKEAYIYGYPMAEAYRRLCAWFGDEHDPLHLGPWNTLVDLPYRDTSHAAASGCPDTDTLRSVIGLDLRSEPMVLTVPPMAADRYFSMQCIDACTHDFAYFGSSGSFLIAGPGWVGEPPVGLTRCTVSETALGLAILRIRVMSEADRAGAAQLMQGCRALSLSAYLREPPPPPMPPIAYVKPTAPGGHGTATELFRVLGAVLGLCAAHPSEAALIRRFARIGLRAGVPMAVHAKSSELQRAIERGGADAWLELAALQKRIETQELAPASLYGSRQGLGNDYLLRMAGAVQGLFGDSAEELMCWTYRCDADGNMLLGAHRYTLRFAFGQLPPVHAFWSLTMCKAVPPASASNPPGLRAIDSSMVPDLVRDADGGITLNLQQSSPGIDREANWLPAPAGPFAVTLRLYRPRTEVLEGHWSQPPIERVPATRPIGEANL